MPRVAIAVLLCSLALPLPSSAAGNAPSWCGTTRGAAHEASWAHREQAARRGVRATAARASAYRQGQLLVVPDEGDLALLRNPVDLATVAIRFAPSADGYTAARIGTTLFPETGQRLALGDDASAAVALPFEFAFFGRSHGSAFVNSDGNLTFEEADSASTARNVGRLIAGPPRIAPLLADLDPSAGGSVSVTSQPDRFTATWTNVPKFDGNDRNTVQVTLYPDGRVDLAYGTLSTDFDEAAAGIAPGGERGGLTAVDLSNVAAGGAGAIAEGFRAEDGLDTLATARKLYASFGDDFDQLVVFTSRPLTPSGVLAFEQTVKTDDEGIGVEPFDASAEYGSDGRLESFVLMDAVSKYPDNLTQLFNGEDSTLSVLAHEVGHRWLADALYRDGDAIRDDLLGRDGVHWSFFMDSQASHLEGNALQDLGNGSFRTVGASLRYSPLDQYLMGLRPPEEVPAFFVVRSPRGLASLDPGRDPRTGVTFGGTRKDVTVADVIAALGPRRPEAGQARTTLRQAYVFVPVGTDGVAPAALDKVERIRAAFPAFFARSTEGRASVETELP